jgi:hypothetical protein
MQFSVSSCYFLPVTYKYSAHFQPIASGTPPEAVSTYSSHLVGVKSAPYCRITEGYYEFSLKHLTADSRAKPRLF